MTEEHQLLAVIEATDVGGRDVGGLDPLDLQLDAMQRLVGHLGRGRQQLADDVVAVGYARRKAIRRLGHGLEQRPVGAVAHDEGEEANVPLPD